MHPILHSIVLNRTSVAGALLAFAVVSPGCDRGTAYDDSQGTANSTAPETTQTAKEQARERAELARDQTEDRRDLAKDQAQERADMRQDQAEEMHQARNETRENAIDAKEDADEACEGVPTAAQFDCPVATAQVSRVTHTSDGVKLKMRATAGKEDQVEKRIECYQARAIQKRQTQAIPAGQAPSTDILAASCVLDVPDLDVDVSTEDRATSVEIGTDANRNVPKLQQLADKIYAKP